MPSLQYIDDIEGIENEDELWRRIPSDSNMVVYDENIGYTRPSSMAFKRNYDLSVLLAKVVLAHGNGPEFALEGHAGFYLASITAGLAREYGQGVMQDEPKTAPWHAIVWGDKPRSVRKCLAKGASWVIPPA